MNKTSEYYKEGVSELIKTLAGGSGVVVSGDSQAEQNKQDQL